MVLGSLLLYKLVKRGEQSLQQSLSLLQAVIEGTTDAIFVKDLQGQYILANSTTARLIGQSIPNLIGKDDYELIQSKDAAMVRKNDAEVVANRETVTIEEVLQFHGQTFIYSSTKYPWYDNAGQVQGLIGVARDITVNKRLEQERVHLLQTLQQQNRSLNALNAVTKNAISTLDLNSLLQTLLTRLVDIIPAQAGMICLQSDQGLVVSSVVGESMLQSSEGRAIALEMAQAIAETPHVLYIHDTQQDARFKGYSRDRWSTRSILSVPLERNHQLIGVLQVEWNTPQPRDEQQVHLLEITAERCAVAVLNAQLFERTKQLQERLQLQMEYMPIAFMINDRNHYFIEWNPAAERIFGYTRAQVMHQHTWHLIVPPDFHEGVENVVTQVTTTHEPHCGVGFNITKDGRTLICEWHLTPLLDTDGAFVGVLAMAQDVTEREQAREQLRESEARFRSLIDSLPFCCWAFDVDRRYTFQNAVDVQQWGNVVGQHQDEVIQNSDGRLDIWRDLSRRALNGEIIHDESEYTLEGKTQHFLTVGGPIRDGDRIYGVVGASINITDRKQAEAQLRHYAFYDALTGLPQRNILLERLADLMQAAKMGDRRKFALLHLDLVRFKVIKYSLGHDLAEELLVAMAHRLQPLMPPGAMLTRTGGADEFAVLLENLNEFETAIQFAEFLLQQLARPFQLREHELFVNASMGIVFSSDDNRTHIQDANDFLQAADTAMHQARQTGIGQCAVFDPIMQIEALNRLQLDSELRRAIDQQELQLYYQPIINLSTRQLTGFEALVRWQHPQRGMVSPAQFIPLAEETGLILTLGAWVLRQACGQLQQWNHQFPACSSLTLSVNLSTLQLLQPDLLDQIDRILQETQVSPQQLKLEITETSIMQNAQQATPILRTLKDRGIRLSIDDFGTGYSSLTYLNTFPLDTLKIDRAFVMDIGKTAESLEITRTIVLLARTLNLDVTAEGIETDEQMEHLQALQCDLGQGYLFSRPLPVAGIEALLQRDRWVL